MNNVVGGLINLLNRPEPVLAIVGAILIIAGVFSSIIIHRYSISLSNTKSVIAFITGFILIFLSMLSSWWPLFDKKVGCKELTDIQNIVINARDMAAIAQRHCGGDFMCDRHTLLAYNRSNDAINYISTTINNNPSVKATCP